MMAGPGPNARQGRMPGVRIGASARDKPGTIIDPAGYRQKTFHPSRIRVIPQGTTVQRFATPQL